jgi:lipid-A-disaccharide synthase
VHIFLSCGEASSDRYGAALAAALRARAPHLRLSAMGGEALRAAGVEIVQASGELAVMGFGEVLQALPVLLRARRRVWSHLVRAGVDLVVPIDYPGFNLRLAARAHKLGLPVFYLIPPQLWAWGGWRIRELRRNVDRLGTILPFEQDFFSRRGVPAVGLGHPLMEEYATFPFEKARAAREERLQDPAHEVTLGLLPGSRKQEVRRLLPELKVAASMLQSALAPRPLRTVVSMASGLGAGMFETALESGMELIEEPLPHLLARLDLALVCSGTASLEVALAGVPHEIVYAASPFNYWIARRLVRVSRVGLANLILERDLVREHLQEHLSPLVLYQGLAAWVASPEARAAFHADARRLRDLCGEPGTWDRAAAAVLDLFLERATGRPPS